MNHTNDAIKSTMTAATKNRKQQQQDIINRKKKHTHNKNFIFKKKNKKINNREQATTQINKQNKKEIKTTTSTRTHTHTQTSNKKEEKKEGWIEGGPCDEAKPVLVALLMPTRAGHQIRHARRYLFHQKTEPPPKKLVLLSLRHHPHIQWRDSDKGHARREKETEMKGDGEE